MSTQHGFWIAVTDNRVFDGFVTRHLLAHGDIVTINAFYESDSYSFANIVRRLKAGSSSIRVLFYTWAGRKRMNAETIGAVPTLDGMETQSDLLLKDMTGELVTIPAGDSQFIFLDPRVPDARTSLSDRVRRVADLVRSDGVALDSAIRTPRFLRVIDHPERYPPAFDSMIQDISERTPLTIFNNLSARSDQEQLLEFAHGASIELFGLNDRITREPTFAADIQPYINAIGRHGDRTFLVFGRASRNRETYTTYDQDWQWQRYLHCAYLLAAGANTRWKQHAGFLTSPFGGRAGGLDVYADALHDLGSPLGNYTVEEGCYRRAFERGLVLVVPFESHRPAAVSLARPMFTPEGTRVIGRVTVAPGEGRLLLRRQPAGPPVLSRQFNPRSNPLWRWSALRRESGAWYLHLDPTPDDERSEHDLALDLVRYRALRGVATLWYRTSDLSAHIETVVEVDDEQQKMRFALVDGSLGTGPDHPPREGQFRGMAPRGSQFKRLPVIGGGPRLRADGQWHRLGIDLDAACTGSGRYEFRRAVFMRLLGSLDVRRVGLHTRPIPARARGQDRPGGR
jgi:hypothetical protein